MKRSLGEEEWLSGPMDNTQSTSGQHCMQCQLEGVQSKDEELKEHSQEQAMMIVQVMSRSIELQSQGLFLLQTCPSKKGLKKFQKKGCDAA